MHFGKWLAGETNLRLQDILKLHIHGTTCGALKMEAECSAETTTATCRTGCCIEKKARNVEYFKLNILIINKTGNVRIHVTLRHLQLQYLTLQALIQQ